MWIGLQPGRGPLRSVSCFSSVGKRMDRWTVRVPGDINVCFAGSLFVDGYQSFSEQAQ